MHGNLSGENIFFNPSKPDSFYVTAWGRSLTIADGMEISDWDAHVAHDWKSLRTLFTRESEEPEEVSMTKKLRYSDDGSDGESMKEDEYLYEEAVAGEVADDEDGYSLVDYLSLSPPSGSVVAAYTAEEAAPTHTE